MSEKYLPPADQVKCFFLTSPFIEPATDPDGLARFGGAHELESIPEGLEIKQVGQNPNHYELTPKEPMTMEQYQNLLNQVKFK
jgi:hypothetical protein